MKEGVLSQCRKDIVNLNLALKATRERAADLIVEEMIRRGAAIVVTDFDVFVLLSEEQGYSFEILKVTEVSLPQGGDNVIITGTVDEDLDGRAEKRSVSVYDIDNPEAILTLLELTAR